jgi:hypothetical protein
MNIGDRVRLLYHKQEGIITKFLPNDMVEVEIEEGFRIPVLRSELVVIAREENIVFGKNGKKPQAMGAASATAEVKVWSEIGLYIAFVPFNDQQLAVYLLNNTDVQVMFTFGESNNGSYNGIAFGTLQRRSSQKVHEVSLQNFEKWSPILIQALLFKHGYGSFKEPVCKKMKFTAETFFKNQKQAPILDQVGYVFQIDQEPPLPIKSEAIRPEIIKESMLYSNRHDVPAKVVVASRPKIEVDLHIERLTEKSAVMNSKQILQLQLDTFEKQLDNAIMAGIEKVIFIHGVGNGVLRNEIHKKLSKHALVEYFQDAQKEKFGYGATSVKLK